MRKWLNKLKVCAPTMIHFHSTQENTKGPHQLEVFQHLLSVLNHSCSHLSFFLPRKPELQVQLPVSATCCRAMRARFSLRRAPLRHRFSSLPPRRPYETSCRWTLSPPKNVSLHYADLIFPLFCADWTEKLPLQFRRHCDIQEIKSSTSGENRLYWTLVRGAC